jgi:hypothetical protein
MHVVLVALGVARQAVGALTLGNFVCATSQPYVAGMDVGSFVF